MFKMTEVNLQCEHSCKKSAFSPPTCGNNPKMKTRGKLSLISGKTKKQTSKFSKAYQKQVNFSLELWRKKYREEEKGMLRSSEFHRILRFWGGGGGEGPLRA